MVNVLQEQPITVEQAAQLCGVKERTIYRWFERGLERVNLGGVVRTSREALARFARDTSAQPELVQSDMREAIAVLNEVKQQLKKRRRIDQGS